MKHYQFILFDLDGTLSDPKIGITKSVQYALTKMGFAAPELDKLEGFIGPPLQESFANDYHFDKEQTQVALEFYRERFKDKGMFENELYPDIPLLLQDLSKQGSTLVVATSKPTVFAVEILKFFKLDQYFDLIIGSHLDGTRTAKTEIIQFILEEYPNHKLEDFIMIGDRKHDIIGAQNTGIDSIGVTYGYGSSEELTLAEPTYLVKSVDELRELLVPKSSGEDHGV